jgi:hypothetical protein
MNSPHCTFKCNTTFGLDDPEDIRDLESELDRREIFFRILYSWGRIDSKVRRGVYLMWPEEEARVASIEAIDLLLTLLPSGPDAGEGLNAAAPAEFPDLVSLDQAAGAVHKTKRALECYKKRGMHPPPKVKGGGGKADFWDWKVIRP